MNQSERLRDREERYKHREGERKRSLQPTIVQTTNDTNAYKGSHIWHFTSILYDTRAINTQLYLSKQNSIALKRQPHLPNMHTNQSFSNSFHLIYAAELVELLMLYTHRHKILYEPWAPNRVNEIISNRNTVSYRQDQWCSGHMIME